MSLSSLSAKHRHHKAKKLAWKLNNYPALAADFYTPYKKQGWIEKHILDKKKQKLSPQERRAFEDELLEREKLILGEMWNEKYDWGWHEMSRLIDIPARAKAAGVEPFGKWKGFNKDDEEEELGYGSDDWLAEDETEVDEEEERTEVDEEEAKEGDKKET
ncbi:MAG: hypothetical protein Q9221_004304 [Calogaya cf. arnoldii]